MEGNYYLNITTTPKRCYIERVIVKLRLFPKALIVPQEVWEARQQQLGAGVFHVKARDQNTNMTHHLSQLVPLARRVGGL